MQGIGRQSATVPYPIGQHVCPEGEVYDILRCNLCRFINAVEHEGAGRTFLSAFRCQNCREWLHIPRSPHTVEEDSPALRAFYLREFVA